MIAEDLRSLIGVRAEQLAYIVLTRRTDIDVKRNFPASDMGIDLTVTVLENGKETGQIFGVQVKGIQSSTGFRKIASEKFGLTNVPFPIVQVVFSMENDEGAWRWLVEPILEGNTPAGAVRIPERAPLEHLTNDAVANFVDSVRRWYKARLSLV